MSNQNQNLLIEQAFINSMQSFRKILPPRFKSASMEDLNLTEQRQKALLSWLESDAWCLFVHGLPGRGKTHAAIALLCEGATRECLAIHQRRPYDSTDARPRTVMCSVPELVDNLREEAQGKPVNWHCYTRASLASEFRPHRTQGLLLLDDFGAQQHSPSTVARLYQVISYRYDRLLRTIVTSNQSLDEIASLVHDRLASRLAEGLALEFTGPDLRQSRK